MSIIAMIHATDEIAVLHTQLEQHRAQIQALQAASSTCRVCEAAQNSCRFLYFFLLFMSVLICYFYFWIILTETNIQFYFQFSPD